MFPSPSWAVLRNIAREAVAFFSRSKAAASQEEAWERINQHMCRGHQSSWGGARRDMHSLSVHPTSIFSEQLRINERLKPYFPHWMNESSNKSQCKKDGGVVGALSGHLLVCSVKLWIFSAVTSGINSLEWHDLLPISQCVYCHGCLPAWERTYHIRSVYDAPKQKKKKKDFPTQWPTSRVNVFWRFGHKPFSICPCQQKKYV